MGEEWGENNERHFLWFLRFVSSFLVSYYRRLGRSARLLLLIHLNVLRTLELLQVALSERCELRRVKRRLSRREHLEVEERGVRDGGDKWARGVFG